jgi:hypothetical protein
MKHFWTLTIPSALLVFAMIAQGQDAPKLNARELFYSPPPSPSANNSNIGAANGAANNGKAGTGSAGTGTVGTATGKSGGSASGAAGAGKSGPAVAGTGKGSTSSGGAGSTVKDTGVKDTGKDSGTVVASVGQGGSAAGNGPLGLRYAVLKRESGASFHEVDPETKFRTGDSIRLNVTPSTSGYLYVVQQGASGIWTLLFPRPDVKAGSNFVEKGQMLAVPNEKAMWTFDAHAGEEKLFIVLARKPEPDLDKLIYSIGANGSPDAGAGQKLVAQAKVQDEVVNRLREQMHSRDLIFEKVDETTSDSTGVKAENAAYVVSQNPSPDARLVKDLTLSHQ